MVRTTRWLLPAVVALALLVGSAGAARAQVCYYPPAPVAVAPAPVTTYYAPPVTSYYAPVTSYYAPAPVVSYYAPAPVVSYYAAPATGVTTYRYGPLGRLRSVSSYYAPGYRYYP